MPTTIEIQNHYNERRAIIDKWRDAQSSQMRETNNPNLSEGLIRSLHEQLLVQEKFFADMRHMRNILSVMLTEISLNKTEKNQVIEYMAKLDKLITTNKAFINDKNDVIATIKNAQGNISTQELAQAIQTQYATNEQQEFVSALATISPEGPELDAIVLRKASALAKNKQIKDAGTSTYSGPEASQTRGISHFSIMPTQFIPKMTMPLKEVKGQAESIIKKQNAAVKNLLFNEVLVTSIIDTLENTISNAGVGARVNLLVGTRTATKNAEALFTEDLNPEEKKEIALRKILSINMNTPLAVQGDSEVKDFNPYLQTILLKAYSDHFQIHPNTKEFSIVGNNYGLIHEALGIDMKKTDRIVLDPQKFNADLLDQLYIEDKKNPLWRVLKSTKPVDAQFTAAQKIKSYEEVALEFKNEKIGPTEKSVKAFQVVKAAKAIATEYGEEATFKSAFAPKEEDGLGVWFVKKGKEADKAGITKYLTQIETVPKIKVSPSTESFAPSFNSGSDSSSLSSRSDSSEPELSEVSTKDEQPWTPDIIPQAEELNKLEQMQLQLHTIQQELRGTKEELVSSQNELEAATSQMQQAELRIAEAPKIIQQELIQTKEKLVGSQQELESAKKAHSEQLQKAESQLVAAQQTLQKQSTSLTMEQQKTALLATELGSAKGEISAHIAEEVKLTSKVRTLQEENDALKTELTEVKQNIQNTDEIIALADRKMFLSFSLGSMKDILTKDDQRDLQDKIKAITNSVEADLMAQKFMSLNRISLAVDGITDNLKKRDGFFNSAPVKKINAINEAFKTLSLEQKIELSQLDDSTIKEKLNDKDPIGAFLKAVNQNRALIGVSSETTSFKDFKKELSGLKAKPDEAPEARHGNGPGAQ